MDGQFHSVSLRWETITLGMLSYAHYNFKLNIESTTAYLTQTRVSRGLPPVTQYFRGPNCTPGLFPRKAEHSKPYLTLIRTFKRCATRHFLINQRITIIHTTKQRTVMSIQSHNMASLFSRFAADQSEARHGLAEFFLSMALARLSPL